MGGLGGSTEPTYTIRMEGVRKMELSGYDAEQVAQAMTNVIGSRAGTPTPRKTRKPRLGDESRAAGGPTIDSEHTSSIHVRQKVYHTTKTTRAVPRELKIDVTWQVIVDDDTVTVRMSRGATWMIDTFKSGHQPFAVNSSGEAVLVSSVVTNPTRPGLSRVFTSDDAARSWVHQIMLTEKG